MKKRSKYKTKRQYREEAQAKLQAEARERRRQANIEHLTRTITKPASEGSSKIKPLAKPKPWRPEEPKYPSLNGGVEPVRTFKGKPKYDGDLAEREAAAQEEIKRKKARTAPAYNKGGYMYITDGTDPRDLGRKNPT